MTRGFWRLARQPAKAGSSYLFSPEQGAETTGVLGKPFEEVNRWLDEFAGQPPDGMRHRKLRHHLAGIEQARKLWGDQAARLHISADLKQEGWTEDQPFPRDEEHYRRMGLF
jgi:hypothetical protein